MFLSVAFSFVDAIANVLFRFYLKCKNMTSGENICLIRFYKCTVTTPLKHCSAIVTHRVNNIKQKVKTTIVQLIPP